VSGEGAQQRATLERVEKTNTIDEHDWPRDVFGTPLLRVSVSQSELIPTAQYANVTLGPVQVVGFITDGPDEQVKEQLRRLRRLCDESIAEDRQTLYAELQQRAATGQSATSRPPAGGGYS
jgi:hypothetical protein